MHRRRPRRYFPAPNPEAGEVDAPSDLTGGVVGIRASFRVATVASEALRLREAVHQMGVRKQRIGDWTKSLDRSLANMLR